MGKAVSEAEEKVKSGEKEIERGWGKLYLKPIIKPKLERKFRNWSIRLRSLERRLGSYVNKRMP